MLGLAHMKESRLYELDVLEVIISNDHILDAIVKERNCEVDVVDCWSRSMVDERVVLDSRQGVSGRRAWELVMLNRHRHLRAYPPYVDELVVREGDVAMVMG